MDTLIPAILRSYNKDHSYEDSFVQVRHDHGFTDPYADTVPFAVGSNQTIIPFDVNNCDCIDLNDWLLVNNPIAYEPAKYLSNNFNYLVAATQLTLANEPELMKEFVKECPSQL